MRRSTPALALTATLASATLLLSGCGDTSLEGDEPQAEGSAAAVEVAKDDALAAKVPEAIAKKGTLKVGTQASYAPMEFTDADGRTIKGVDIDLFNAAMAKLGLRAEYENANFDTIITGVTARKYDVGVSGFTINEKRKKQVQMVSYFNAGSQWAAAKGKGGFDVTKPCGLKVAVQTGTVQHEEELPKLQEACGDKKIEVLPFEGQDQASEAVSTGRADATVADSPVVQYAVKQSSGKLELVGDMYASAPYGFVMTNENKEFANVLVEALKALEADGSYKKILEGWGVEAGAATTFAVNP